MSVGSGAELVLRARGPRVRSTVSGYRVIGTSSGDPRRYSLLTGQIHPRGKDLRRGELVGFRLAQRVVSLAGIGQEATGGQLSESLFVQTHAGHRTMARPKFVVHIEEEMFWPQRSARAWSEQFTSLLEARERFPQLTEGVTSRPFAVRAGPAHRSRSRSGSRRR